MGSDQWRQYEQNMEKYYDDDRKKQLGSSHTNGKVITNNTCNKQNTFY